MILYCLTRNAKNKYNMVSVMEIFPKHDKYVNYYSEV